MVFFFFQTTIYIMCVFLEASLLKALVKIYPQIITHSHLSKSILEYVYKSVGAA